MTLVSSALARDVKFYWRAARGAKHAVSPLDRAAWMGDLIAVATLKRWPFLERCAARHLAVCSSVTEPVGGDVVSIA